MEKYLQLLREQLDRLDRDDFNLSSWKESTQILLDRIFGSSNTFSSRIEAISTDHSSWSLRDTSGRMSIKELSRAQGKDILSIAIRELELSNEDPNASKKRSRGDSLVLGALENGLKVSQYREIAEIYHSDRIDEDKLKLLEDAFLNFGTHTPAAILADLVMKNGIPE
jgi:hypothetical protein